MSFRSRLVLCGCVFALTVTATAAPNLYRYRDSNGTGVIGASVSPEYVKYGYEVLSATGRVVEVVPRAPAPEEIAAREAAQAQAERERELAREKAEEDALLLRLYGGQTVQSGYATGACRNWPASSASSELGRAACRERVGDSGGEDGR